MKTGIPSGLWSRDPTAYQRLWARLYLKRCNERVSSEPRDFSKLYEQALQLHQQGLGPDGILRKLGIPLNMIRGWLYSGTKPRSGFCRSMRLVRLKPTEDIGYLTGLVFGDGSIYHSKKTRNYGVRLSTTDPELLECFVDIARKVGLNPHTWKRRSERVKWGRFYRQTELGASADSKILYEFLRKYKLPDYRWHYPQECGTNGFAKGFLQGMFDAEASVDFGNRRGTREKRIYVAQKHLENIKQIEELLKRFGIENLNIYKNHTCWELRMNCWRDIEVFHRLIGFRLPRKQQKLEQMFEWRKDYLGGWND